MALISRIGLGLCAAVLCWVSGTGCSVYMAARQAEHSEIFVLDPGTPRAEVIASFGTLKAARYDGGSFDVFTFLYGRDGEWRMVRAVGHGVADLATAGLWELLATPVELPRDQDFMTIQVLYDQEERVADHRTLSNAGRLTE